MKQKCNLYLLTTLTLCIFLLGGCKNKINTDAMDDATKGSVTIGVAEITPGLAEVSPGLIESGDNTEDKNNVIPTPNISLMNTKEIFIYSMNANSTQKEAITALIPEDTEITPVLIVDMVEDAMADASFIIGIDSVDTDGDSVIVSFLNNQPPVVNVSKEVETSILDAIAQSLLDNLTDYNKVIFRIMGDSYQTDNYSFDLNHIYMEKLK